MSIRVNRNLSLKERRTYTFDDFKGVDFSSSPYKVAGKRAIQAKNLIYKDGTVRKRTGWQSLCKLDSRIDGLFSFKIGVENIILCYAGAKFYRLNWNETRNRLIETEITNTCTYDPAKIDPTQLKENRIQVIINGDRAYIVGCGDYLVYGNWGAELELRRVFDNEDTYIPTTTINIDVDGVADENRATLDEPNLLSSRRKNEFLGVDAESGTWTVDTAIKGVEQAIDDDTLVEITVHTYNSDSVPSSIHINNRFTGDNRTNLYTVGDTSEEVGEIDFATGKITLNINTKPQEDNTSNIVVTFSNSRKNQESSIASATLATVFGGGGTSNRLFISGDPDHVSIHRWSEMYDYTYFPHNNYDVIGSDSSAIMGYVRASDGTLLVFKEQNGNDSTVYYITGDDIDDVDFRGDVIATTKFYKKAGNSADTIYGKYATANLNGDNLILTRNGVKGLQLYENVSINNYRMQERGRNVNGKLLKHSNLADACGFSYEDKYFLSVGDAVYIADSRFTFQDEEDISSSFNYEWWYWDNVDARVWCEIGGELYFGTSEGRICKFHNDYADITFEDFKSGTFSISPANNYVIGDKTAVGFLQENDNIVFTIDGIYASYLINNDITKVDETRVYVSAETIEKVYDGIKVYADSVDSTGLSQNVEYVIGEVDLDNCCFSLLKDGEAVTLKSTGFSLCKNISWRSLFITEIDILNSNFKLKEFESAEIIKLVTYGESQPTGITATITYKHNIRAEWYTPIYDLGTNMLSKTLLNVTIATEPLYAGTVTVGYQTRNLEREFIAKGSRVFDFNDINFEDFSFESSFASSYTIPIRERNFNFVVIRYISDNKHACAVNSIAIRYKINQVNKGVR